MTAVLMGCSKSDDNGGDNASLVGTWKFTAHKIDGTPQVLNACDIKNTAIFTETTWTTIYFSGDGPDCEEMQVESPYTRNGDVITAGNISVQISKLTTTTLVTQATLPNNKLSEETYTRQ